MEKDNSTFFVQDIPRHFRNPRCQILVGLSGFWTSHEGRDGCDVPWVTRLPPQVVPRAPRVLLRSLSRGCQSSPPGRCGCDDVPAMKPHYIKHKKNYVMRKLRSKRFFFSRAVLISQPVHIPLCALYSAKRQSSIPIHVRSLTIMLKTRDSVSRYSKQQMERSNKLNKENSLCIVFFCLSPG